MDAQAAERLLLRGRELKRRFPEGRSQVMFVCDGAPAPERAVSERLNGIYDPSVSGIVCVAAVLEGSGFWASGIRSMITNMRMTAGAAGAVRTQETIEEVVRWLPEEHLKRSGVRLNATALAEALTIVRERGTIDGK